MKDGPVTHRAGLRIPVNRPVEALAGEALSVLARSRVNGSHGLRDAVLSEIQELLLTQASDWRYQLENTLRVANLSSGQMIDHGVPVLARRIGAQWVENRIGFSDVSIACARLQTVVRDFSKHSLPTDLGSDSSDVAVIVRGYEQHILGASVLTSQLRKLGLSVRFLVGMDDKGVVRELQTHSLDAILISSALSDALEQLTDFVRVCRNATGGLIPVVVGGPVRELVQDVAEVTGADFATSDLEEVLQKCNLTAPLLKAGPLVRT